MPPLVLPHARRAPLWAAASLSVAFGQGAVAQQVADSSFRPAEIAAPMHVGDSGPRVLVDAAHHNFHASDGLYKPFAMVLEADGYRVAANAAPFTEALLAGTDVLVIATAQQAAGNRQLPAPSAFRDAELDALVEFVDAGGGLFVIVDQMPYPGAAAELAARFGLELPNDVVGVGGRDGEPIIGPTVFKKAEGTIGDHAITRGRNAGEAIDQVMSFSGSAFPITSNAVSLIHYGDDGVVLFPTVAREFATAARAMAPGWSQGAALEHGQGRVVLFAEAAMFSSQQTATTAPIGLVSAEAEDNQQLLLNIVRWLAADLK